MSGIAIAIVSCWHWFWSGGAVAADTATAHRVGESPVLLGSTLVEVGLPLLLDLGHGVVDRRLPRPHALQRLGQEIAARVDGEVRAVDDRDLADAGKRHAVDEGAA